MSHGISDAVEGQKSEVGAHAHRSIIGDHTWINVIDDQLTVRSIKAVAICGCSFFQTEGPARASDCYRDETISTTDVSRSLEEVSSKAARVGVIN